MEGWMDEWMDGREWAVQEDDKVVPEKDHPVGRSPSLLVPVVSSRNLTSNNDVCLHSHHHLVLARRRRRLLLCCRIKLFNFNSVLQELCRGVFSDPCLSLSLSFVHLSVCPCFQHPRQELCKAQDIYYPLQCPQSSHYKLYGTSSLQGVRDCFDIEGILA